MKEVILGENRKIKENIENTKENQNILKGLLMPSAITKNNTLIFPYFN